MSRLLIGLGALLALTMLTPSAMSHQRRGSGAGQGRSGSEGVGVQTRKKTQTRAGNQGQPQRGNQIHQSAGNLSLNTDRPDLLRLREEEKLARDVYTQLAKTSSLPIFRNISRAESQHMQSVERLIRGGGVGPLNDVPGVFVVPEYQRLYESLIASGTRSPLDALNVGAKIEEMDIADLRRILTETNDPKFRQVLERLMRGSENHLRAFALQIAKQGASYKAEFLSQSEFNQIATSRGQQSERGWKNGGQVSHNRGNGAKFGFQRQNSSSQAPGTQSQRAQRGAGQSGGKQGRGKQGRSR